MLYQYILAIIVLHFIGDWLLQSRFMADNKSKFTVIGWIAWSQHIIIYFITMMIGIAVFYHYYPQELVMRNLACWTIFNSIIHGIQDKITSQLTSRFYAKHNYHAFFTTIGFDGMMHYLTLFISAKLMFGF
jgi:hypothetical protein